MSHTIQVPDVPDELLVRLDQRAEQTGLDRAAYIRRLIELDLMNLDRAQRLEEVLAPIHAQVKASNLHESEIEELLDNEIRLSRQERRALKPHAG